MTEGLRQFEDKQPPAVELSEPIDEPQEPVKNKIGGLQRLYYLVGSITAPSKFARSPENPNGKPRPLTLRRRRTEILAKMEDDLEKNDGQDDLERKLTGHRYEKGMRDYLTAQYLKQRIVSVNLPEGKQESRVVELNLPEHLKLRVNLNQPPIIFIPGISNDVECVESLAIEMAMAGRRVIVVGYPESFNGFVTPEFAQAVEGDENFGPHVAYFKTAIEKLSGGKEVELWGHSTGSTIITDILRDKKNSERTTNAVLLCPAGGVKQTKSEIALGVAQEAEMFKYGGAVANYMLTQGGVKPPDKKLAAARAATFNALWERDCRVYNHFPDARVKEGGKILVVSGKKDNVTKSRQAIDLFSANPQMEVLDIPGMRHLTPFVKPEEILPKILEKRFN